MSNFLQSLAMGGYGLYVWPAYGFVCVYLVMNLLGMKMRKIRAEKLLKKWFKR